jgi:hypothetical protein
MNLNYLSRVYCRLDCRKYAFSNRIINMWNSLPSNIIACNTVDNFKHKIDIYLYGQGFIKVSNDFLPITHWVFSDSCPVVMLNY